MASKNLEQTIEYLLEVVDSQIKIDGYLAYADSWSAYLIDANIGKYYIKDTTSSGDKHLFVITKINATTISPIDLGAWPKAGPQGVAGPKGPEPVITISDNNTWVIDGVDTGVSCKGPKGDQGNQGIKGNVGVGLETLLKIDSSNFSPTMTESGGYDNYNTTAELSYTNDGVVRTKNFNFKYKVNHAATEDYVDQAVTGLITESEARDIVEESVPDGTGHLNQVLIHGTTGNYWAKIQGQNINSGVAPLGYYLRSTGSGSAEFISPNNIVTGTSSGDNWTSLTVNGTTKSIPQGGGGSVIYAHVSAYDSMGCCIVVYSTTGTAYTSQTAFLNDLYGGHVINAWMDCTNDTGTIGNINLMYGNLQYSFGGGNAGNVPELFNDGDTVTQI